MYLRYQPEGSGEPTIYKYDPKKMMSAEREALEKKTGLTYEQFHVKLVEGSAVCRRALLWVMIKRTAAATRYEDVDFAWDECELGLYKGEIEDMISAVNDADVAEGEKTQGLAALNEMLKDAIEDPDAAGKAPSKS